MLLIKTYIAPSDIHGLGLFADEDIKSGKLVFVVYDGFFDRTIDLNDPNLSEAAKDHIRHFGYLDQYGWHLDGDNMKFCNHSSEPNLDCRFISDKCFALRDISKGEELTVYYSHFDLSLKLLN